MSGGTATVTIWPVPHHEVRRRHEVSDISEVTVHESGALIVRCGDGQGAIYAPGKWDRVDVEGDA